MHRFYSSVRHCTFNWQMCVKSKQVSEYSRLLVVSLVACNFHKIQCISRACANQMKRMNLIYLLNLPQDDDLVPLIIVEPDSDWLYVQI